MRRLVAVLVVAVIALALTGCGGGKEPASTAAKPPAPAAAPVKPPKGDDAFVDRTPLAEVKFESFPNPKTSREATGLPAAITERLESDQPMLLFFFDPRQETADDQRAEIDALLKEYRGTIDLLSYDVGQPVADGVHDDADTQAVTLARALQVDFTPYVVLVDEQGIITWRHRGFVDRQVMERELLRATE